MELGIGMFGDLNFNPQTMRYQSPSERLKEIVEEVQLADELGIDSFAMGEHHREDYAVSSPEIMLAALATVTKNIRLTSGVNVISSADPVKLFQDYVMLDLISGHRVEMMAGRGSFIESFPLFGYNLQDYNELFEEKLNLLITLRDEEVINWKGRFRPEIRSQTIYPRQERPLPISIAVGGTPSSVLRAANMGLPIVFAIIGGNPAQFKPLIDGYKEVYEKAGHNQEEMKIGVHSHTFIADSASSILDTYYPLYARAMNKLGQERGWGSNYSPASFQAGMSPNGALYMGEPEYVAEKIIKTLELFGIKQYIAHLDVGGPTHAQLMKTIEMYGTKVIPVVKKHFEGK